MSVRTFDGNDREYLAWRGRHREGGFVLNCRRASGLRDVVLHHASCMHLYDSKNEIERPGLYTERQFFKVCSLDREALLGWVRARGVPRGARRCRTCMRPGPRA